MRTAGAVLILAGSALSALAALGVLRLPDVYLRINAATKASSLGVVCILAGVALLEASTRATLTLAIAIAFLLITGPVAAHVLGRAAYRSGTRLWSGTVTDDLTDDVGETRATD